jgi:endoglucanase
MFQLKRTRVIILFLLLAALGALAFAVFLFGQPKSSPPQGQTARLPGLYVSGNQLVNETGQLVVLHGVNRSGAEYACIQGWGFMDGPSDAASIQAMTRWKINAVRVPVNEHCWLGLRDVNSQYAGAAYRDFIMHYVALLNHYGLYVILDLHESGPGTTGTINQPMPNREHSLDFWKSVAKTFKGNTTVLFDALNEPHLQANTPAAWQCWRDGGSCPGVAFPVAGMQEIVEAIRSTGATNVILLAALDWANDLSQWLKYKPDDPLDRLAASFHVYLGDSSCSSTLCYEATVRPVAAHVPLIVTEVGESCAKASLNESLTWFDSQQVGYLAWTWDTWGTACSDASFITNYNGTPTPYGQRYKEHLASLTAGGSVAETRRE